MLDSRVTSKPYPEEILAIARVLEASMWHLGN
jgi:hypothetical protein